MATDAELPSRYRFDQSIDVLTTLDTLGIEHLEVSNERTIIIYDRTIIDCEVADGQLHDARTVAVDVFELPPDMNADADRLALIESLIEEIATTAMTESDWDRL